jgi:hypothetical protein
VAHTYNPNYLGGRDGKNQSLKPDHANSSGDPHLQNNQSEIGWRCGSSGRAPVLQAQRPEFKPQFHQKQNKTKNTHKKGKNGLVCRGRFWAKEKRI